MSEAISLGTTRIRYEGLYDWKKLYNTIHDWFGERQYEAKHRKKPRPFGYQYEFEASGERDESNYVKFVIKIKLIAFHIEDVDVIVDGKKEKKNKTGMMTIDLEPIVELDYEKKWETSPAKKKAREFLHKYIMSAKVGDWKDKLHAEAYKLHTEIKKELNLESKYLAE